MAWTKVDEMYIKNYTGLIVAGKMTIDQVPLKYQEEVQKRVDAWFTEEALRLKAESTEI